MQIPHKEKKGHPISLKVELYLMENGSVFSTKIKFKHNKNIIYQGNMRDGSGV